MALNQLVVIGTSAGGIEALRSLVAALPHDFPAPICVVMHTSPQSPGVLPDILARAGALPAMSPRQSERLRAGWIYVAPPDCHLIVEPGLVRATKGPRENRFRPAIDPLFRSAAQVYGPATVGVILTGNLDDGTAGLLTVKQLGGVAIVQDPGDAMFPSMPAHALEYVKADHVVTMAALPALLQRLVGSHVAAVVSAAPDVEVDVNIAREVNAMDAGVEGLGDPSAFACPECHGVLLRMKAAGPACFRCHTGHAYSMDSLLAEMNDGIEASLWGSIRALEESALLVQQLAAHVREHDPDKAERLTRRMAEAHRQAKIIRDLVTLMDAPVVK